MKMKTLFLSTVALLALGGAAHATDLVCSAPQFLIGQQSKDPQDTVNRIEIRYASNSHEWQVSHRFLNDSMVAREEQYAMIDASNSNVWAWRGRLKRNGAITMSGEVSRDYRGQLTYTETQADRGRVTMQTRSICNVGTLTATAPATTTAPAATAQATTGPSLAEQLAAKQAEQEAEQRRKQAEQEAEQRRQQAALEAEQQRQRAAAQAAEQKRKQAEWEAEQKRKQAEWEVAQQRNQAEWEAQQARVRDALLNHKLQQLDAPGVKKEIIPLKVKNNVMRLNVGLGDQVLTMLLDTGASSTLISSSLALSLIRDDQARFVGDTKFTMASGEVVRAKEIVIKEVKIGNQIVRDVKAAAIPGETDLLLGVDVLNAIGPYLIDSQNSQLIFAFASKENA
jgi:predicted aspartyl protease